MELQASKKDKTNWDVGSSANSIRNYDAFHRIESMKADLKESFDDIANEDDVKIPSLKAREEAETLMTDLLPFEEPIISCLPDGGIAFQWIKRPHSILTFSVYGEGKITYAATFRSEGEKHRGTVEIKSHSLSKCLLDYLNNHFSSDKFPWISTSKTVSQ